MTGTFTPSRRYGKQRPRGKSPNQLVAKTNASEFMIHSEFKDHWLIGPYSLRLLRGDGPVRLNHQTPDWELLSTLAAAGFRDVADCALDIVFNHSPCVGDWDAMAAYSLCPLEEPPAAYMERFRKVDWSSDTPCEARYAIILAGRKDEADKALLLQILQRLSSDYLDAALYAASSFCERRFVEQVASVALSTCEDEAWATAEIHAYLFCFRRWLETEFISLTELREILASAHSSQASRISWKVLMNYIVCQDWRRLPFPEAHDCARSRSTRWGRI